MTQLHRGDNRLRLGLLGHFPPPYGGVATLLEQMAQNLHAAGHDTVVFNLGHGTPCGEYVVNLTRTNVVELLFSLERVFRKEQGRIFHYVSASYRSFWLGTYVQMMAFRYGRPLVWSLVGGGFPQFLANLDPFRRWLAKLALSHADTVITCNREIESAVSRIVPTEKLLFLSNAFPPAIVREEGLPPEVEDVASQFSPLICTTGSSSPEYSLDSALEALSILASRHRDAGLVISLTKHGISPDDAALERSIDEWGVRARVFVARSLPNFHALLRKSDVFIRTPLVDGDSMSVREALIFGIPTVASDTAFRPPGAHLFRKGDGVDMARIIDRTLAGELVVETDNAAKEAEDNLIRLTAIYRAVSHPRCPEVK
jgi:glycogen synthase